MKKKTWLTAVLALGITFLPGRVFAEMIQGIVDSVDKAGSSLTLLRTDPATGAQEKRIVSIAKDAKFKGMKSLDELRPGNSVKVEATATAEGLLEAKSIETS